MKYLFITLSSLTLATYGTFAQAKAKSNHCRTIRACVEKVSRLTGDKYSIATELKGKVDQTSNLRVTKENADAYLSELLFQNGYARVPSRQGQYNIISARDIRYNPTKLLDGNQSKIPSNDDYYMAVYKLKAPEWADGITRSFRPFMTRYGRIIAHKKQGKIIIQDTGRNINRLIGLLTEMDRPLTKDEKEVFERENEQNFEVRALKAKNCHTDGHSPKG